MSLYNKTIKKAIIPFGWNLGLGLGHVRSNGTISVLNCIRCGDAMMFFPGICQACGFDHNDPGINNPLIGLINEKINEKTDDG